MKIKLSEASARALDWLVAHIEGRQSGPDNPIDRPETYTFRPSVDWATGGPIIDREHISVNSDAAGRYQEGWRAFSVNMPVMLGETALVAAMRSYVARVRGDELDVPDTLV